MTKILPISTVREHLTTLVDNAKNRLDEYVVTVNGKPAAVIISAEEYESWKETLDVVSNPGLLGAIRAGQDDLIAGNVSSLQELEQELRDLDHV
jgi:antitoxin YefM